MRTAIIFWVVTVTLPPSRAQDGPPSAEILIRKGVALDKAQDAKGWKFTYREDEEQQPFDKNGKPLRPTHKTYDIIMLEGDSYRKLIKVEGLPPDAKLQKKIDDDLEKERLIRRARRGGTFSTTRTVFFPDVEDLEKLFDSTVTAEEVIAGRSAWRVESVPKANYKPANKEEQELMASHHTTWFDRQEGAWLKQESVLLRAVNGEQPGTQLDLIRGKHGGAWLLDETIFRADTKFAPMVRVRGQARRTFYDYKKFDVETKIVLQ